MIYNVYQSWFHQGIDGELNWLALYGAIVTELSPDRVLSLMGMLENTRKKRDQSSERE